MRKDSSASFLQSEDATTLSVVPAGNSATAVVPVFRRLSKPFGVVMRAFAWGASQSHIANIPAGRSPAPPLAVISHLFFFLRVFRRHVRPDRRRH